MVESDDWIERLAAVVRRTSDPEGLAALIPLLLLALAAPALAQDLDWIAGSNGRLTPLLAELEWPPVAVPAGGRYWLVYELRLSNWSAEEVVVEAVEVWGSTRIVVIEGEELAATIANSNPRAKEKSTIGPGYFAVVMVFAGVDKPPERIHHRIRLRSDKDLATVECAVAELNQGAVLVGPPLKGGMWVAVNGPANGTHHRGGLLVANGRRIVPQRFAIDFVRVDKKGEIHEGNERVNGDHYAYGPEVLGVANATVDSVTDGIPENTPDNKARAVSMSLATVAGNSPGRSS